MKNIDFKTGAKFLIFFFALLFVGVEMAEAIQAPAVSGLGFAGVIPFIALEKDDSENNMAGIAAIAYVIKTSDLETIAKPSLAANTPEGKVTCVGNHVCKAGKFFIPLYSTRELGELLGEIAGPRDGEYFDIKGSLFYPHTNKKGLGMAALLKNADLTIIFKEFSGSGQMRSVGIEDLPARLKPSITTGKAHGDQKGITFALEAAHPDVPGFVYEGSITLEADVVNAPTRLSADANSIDLAISKRFVVGVNTSAITLATIENILPGDVVIIEFDATSQNSLEFTDALGANATLDTDGQWLRITKGEAGLLIDDFKA